MLKAIVDDVSGVPEALRSYYEPIEGDDAGDLAGKFRLKVEGSHGFALDNTDSLKTALSAEREKARQLDTSLKSFEGIDAKKAKEALARIAKIGDLDPAKEADRIAAEKVEAIKTQILGEVEAKETQWTGREKQLVGELNRVLVDSAALSALAAHKGNPKLLQRVVTDRLKLVEKDGQFAVEVVDDKGLPRIKDARGTPMTVEDLVLELKGDKTFGVAFEGSGKSGGGTPPASGGGSSGASGTFTRSEWNEKLGKADEAERRKLTSEYMQGLITVTG